MGRYCTHTSWLSATSSPTQLIPGFTSTIANTVTVINEIARAEGMIDSFLGRLYTPSTYATSPMIMNLAEDITTYKLFTNYIYNRPEGISSKAKTELIENRYNIAPNLLEQFRDGKMEIYDSAGARIETQSRTDRFYVSTRNYNQTFGEDGELAWQLSANKIDDMDSDRLDD